MSGRTDDIIRLSESFPVVLYDGTCRFCNFWIQFILKRDIHQQFRFLALESEYGKAVKKLFGTNLENKDSILVLHHGQVYIFADAVYIILKHLHHPARVLFFLVPRFIRNNVYRIVAKYRHKISFWQKDCIIPGEKQGHQFLN